MMTRGKHRALNSALITFIIFAGIIFGIKMSHSMADCEARLYEKLTKQTAPTTKELSETLRIE